MSSKWVEVDERLYVYFEYIRIGGKSIKNNAVFQKHPQA